MPQLGMTQDSGVIVSWAKAAGEAVAKGDVLFEVETDKATMEVEAAADGFLSGLTAKAGEDVPVGEVIAQIVESEGEVVTEDAPPQEATAPEPAAAPEPEAEPEPQPKAAPKPPAMSSARVLASPKARRLASERGIDLAGLRANGVVEPIHVADLSRAQGGGASILTAEAEGTAFDALLAREDGVGARPRLLAAFAAGAWGAVLPDQPVALALRGLDGALEEIGDAAEGAARLTLTDLCDTRLTGFTPAGAGLALSVARGPGGYRLGLAFREAALPLPAGAALLDEIAARIEDPIRQLL